MLSYIQATGVFLLLPALLAQAAAVCCRRRAQAAALNAHGL